MTPAKSQMIRDNPRVTPKDRNAIKGAIMRAFSRSELRNKIIDSTRIIHHDPKRPRVKKWSLCPLCKKKTPTYLIAVDHINPKVPVDSALEFMTWDGLIDNTWCQENNLQPICDVCHDEKTAREKQQRKENKRSKK